MKFGLFSIHIRWIKIIFKKLNNNDPLFAVGYCWYRIVGEKILNLNITFKHTTLKTCFFSYKYTLF